MPDPDEVREAPSIALAFSECLKLYRHLYFSLTGSDSRVAGQVDVTRVYDNYGRLNVWGSDSGALRTGRGSLDDLLRTNESLRSIVLDTISDLTKSIERATVLADVGPTTDEEPLLADDSDGDSLSSASATSDSFLDGGNRSRPKKGEIHYSLSDIFTYIQSLYKISVSLRRPAVHDKYIRSVSKDANASYFIPWDQSHVENKFRNASEVLIRRLALANTRRRQQLQYWEKHPQDAAEGVLSEAALLKSAIPPTESKPTQSLGIPSGTSKQTFSTVALSAVNDNETFSGRPKTIYQPSLQGASGHLRVPDIPKVLFGQTSFECPYCHTQLEVQTMRKRQLWKKHVFRDLRPYVCTYEGCLNAEKLYVTRHDWMYHEGQLHQRSWICGNHCNRKFSTPQLLREHMRDFHLGTFAESQLPILIDMCERPADPDESAPCPLCGVEASLRALRAHVASHLEEIALFVLPVETDDQDTDADSHHAERPREKDSRLDDDESSSLGSFGDDEDGQPPLQDPKAFEKALKKEGQYSLPEVGDWLDIGQQVFSEEEEREDTVQADLDADVKAKGGWETHRRPPIGYAGYIFTKVPAENAGQKETWAIVHREQMPASQADLKNQVDKSRKRGVTGLDQYMDSEMKGFKRKQIDELIRECVGLDPDHRFEYITASIKRDTRRRESGSETSTMQVILKRQPRADIDMQGPPFMEFGSTRLPSSGFVDLWGYEATSDPGFDAQSA